MFSQFFGGFLLNNGMVTREQLAAALDEKKNTRLRLGVLAINDGLMTAEQVEQVNVTQQTVDKLFGDLAVEMGFLKPTDVEDLLHKQPTDYLLLGQTLVNNGALTNAEFESAINSYKASLSLTDDEISGDQNEKLADLVSEFYHFSTTQNAKLYTNYVSLLYKSLVRFVGDDFTPLEAAIRKSVTAQKGVSQSIGGAYTGFTGICASKSDYRAFAKRFGKDAYFEADEFDDACVGEFLNVCNGLYAVNESNETGTEITLTPLTFVTDGKLDPGKESFSIPVQFTFGEIEFIVAF